MGVCFNKNKERILKTSSKEREKDTLNSDMKGKRIDSTKSPKKNETPRNDSLTKRNTGRDILNTSNNEQKVNNSKLDTKRINDSSANQSPHKNLKTSQTAKFLKTDKFYFVNKSRCI